MRSRPNQKAASGAALVLLRTVLLWAATSVLAVSGALGQVAPVGPDEAKVDAWLAAAEEANEREDPARLYYARYAAKYRGDDVDVLFMLGRYLSYAQHYDASERVLRRVAAQVPEYQGVRLHLLRVLAWAERWDEARVVGDALVADFPDYVQGLVVRGDIELWQGQPYVAEVWYRRALDLEPESLELQWKVLTSLVETGDGDAVRAFLDTLPRAEDDRARARVRMRYAAADTNMRADATVGYTFTEIGDWKVVALGLSWRIAERLWLGGRTNWERRDYPDGIHFEDTTIALPITAILGREMLLTLEGAVTPSADFAPVGAATAEFSHDPLPLVGYAFGYRYAHHNLTEAHTLYPTVAVHFWPFSVEPTLVTTLTTDGQATFSGRLKGIWHASDRGSFELWGFIGSEPVEPVLALTTNPPAQGGVLFGITQLAGPLTRLRFLYSYSTPLDGTRFTGVRPRHSLSVSLAQQFRVNPRGRR